MKEENGRPALGDSATSLGVRVPQDIREDASGKVHPGAHGMSVSPSFETLPLMFMPRRLRHRFPQAVGSNSLRLWRMGTGPWKSEAVGTGLRLELDPLKPARHGLVGPDTTMSLGDYRAALAATQAVWSVVDEPPEA